MVALDPIVEHTHRTPAAFAGVLRLNRPHRQDLAMQVPRVIHRLFHDRDYSSALPTSWTCEPHVVTLRDRSGTVACPRPGWIVRAWFDGFADPAIGYVMVDRYGTGVDYSPVPDPHPQPFEIGAERVYDSGWWRPLAVSPAEWAAFVVSCSQQKQEQATQ